MIRSALHVHALDGHELRGLGDRDDTVGPPEVAPELDAPPALVVVEELGVDEVLEVVGDDDVGQIGLVKRGRAERAEEDVGAEPFERRPVGGRQLQERLEEPVKAPARAEDLPGLLDVEARPEPVEDRSRGEESRHGGFGFRLHEQVELVRAGSPEQGLQESQDEDARSPVRAVRRQGREVDDDPAHRSRVDCSKDTTTKGRIALTTRSTTARVVNRGPSRVRRGPSLWITRLVTVAVR